MSRRAPVLFVALALAALARPAAPAPAAPPPAPAAPARYIVELAAPPPGAAAALADAQGAALAAVAAVTGGPPEPVYVYRHALSGFALDLTAAEAAAVAALPGVARVEPDRAYTVDAAPGPALIGAAQPDLRPALFFAGLSGAQTTPPAATGATGRAVAHYDAAARRLSFQVFYGGLSGPPTRAAFGRAAPGAPGPLALDLAPDAVGEPGTAGGYVGARALDAAAEAALFAGELYVAIETAAAPGGELRGQLVAARGEGVVVGVLDTGVNVGHPSFQDPAPDGYDHENPLGAGTYLGVCSPADPRFDPLFACNDKLIGAYTFADTAATPDPQGQASPRDNHGHGSHVAGTAVGNLVAGAPGGPLSGVAPRAGLVVYDVCGLAESGRSCSGSAILAAVDQAVADGVDVLNLSLSGESRDPWAAADARGLLRAAGAGIFVAASAGNRGPAPGTVGAPGNAPWVTSTASTSHDPALQGALAGADAVDGTSARGPDLSVPDLLKPDLAAPGVAIVAAGADLDPRAADYVQLSGTSMAAPHVAGLAAVLRQIHPGWSPAELRSAMALTGSPARGQGGAPAGPFDQGGGRIAAPGAALAGFVLDVTEEQYRAADPASGGDPSALNLPALIDPGCVGGCVFTRTLRSTLGVPVTWEIEGVGDGFTVTAEPPGPLTLAPGAAATIVVSVAVTAPRPGELGYGSLRFVARGDLAPTATMPVAVPLERSSLPGELRLTTAERSGGATVPLRAVAVEQLAVSAHGLTRLRPELIELAADPTPADVGDILAGGIYQQVLTLPAGNVRFRAQLADSTAPDLNLVVYVDRAGEGYGALGPEDTVLCRRDGPGSAELCDILAPSLLTGRDEAVQVTVLVQNAAGSGAARDRLRLLWGRVGAGPGTLAVSGPASVPAGRPFALALGWSLPEARAGDLYIGVLTLGSSPAAPGSLGSALLTLEVGADHSYLPLVVR